MLAISTEDLTVHTNLLAPLCLLYRIFQIEGEITGDSVLVHLGRVVDSVHLGIRLDKQEEVLLKEEPRPIHHAVLDYLRSKLLLSHSFEGECWIGRLDTRLLV